MDRLDLKARPARRGYKARLEPLDLLVPPVPLDRLVLRVLLVQPARQVRLALKAPQRSLWTPGTR